MFSFEPEPPRYTLEDHGDSFTVTIPAIDRWRSAFAIPFLTVWLGGWALGLVGGLFNELANLSVSAQYHPFITLIPEILAQIFCFNLLVAIPVSAAFLSLWELAGWEVVTVSAHSIVYQQRFFGLNHSRTYQAGQISHLYISEAPRYGRWMRRRSTYRPATLAHPLTFNYDSQTNRIVYQTTEAESKQLLKLILDRFPQYGGE